MDSTACLVWSDAPHIELPFQLSPVGQCDMQEDNPISGHRKFQVSLVAARFCFFHLREHGTHAGMGHVGFNRDTRRNDWFGGSTG